MYEPIDLINGRLIEFYGRPLDSDAPNYRIVWTTHQQEMRSGVYGKFDASGNFLAETAGYELVEKYPLYPDMWVLEYRQYNVVNLELPTNESYEPLWIFGANNSDPNPLWRAVKLLVDSHIKIQGSKQPSPSDLLDEEVRKIAKEKIINKEILSDASPYIAGMLGTGSAVLNAGLPKESEPESNSGE